MSAQPLEVSRLTSTLGDLSVDSQLPEQRLSLPKLPDVVLRGILGYLLLANNVEVTIPAKADNKCQRAYRFETAILRTCKTLYTQGLAILKLNQFIVASTTNASLFLKDAQDHNIVLWTQKLTRFKHYALRVHIISQKFAASKEKTAFLMLCLADLENFICILRHLTYTVANPRWKIQLQVVASADQQESLSIRYQESLLSPFEKLKGVGQSCKVKGNVDIALAKRIEKSMTPTVFWTRARCRDFLDILLRKVAIAREASREKQVAVAYSIYKTITHLWSTPGSFGWIAFQFVQSGDEVLQDNFYNTLMEECQQGLMLSKLWLAESLTAAEVMRTGVDVLRYFSSYVGPGGSVLGGTWRETAWGLRIAAAGYVGLCEYERARQLALSACKLEPNNATHRDAMRLCEQFQTTARLNRIDRLSMFKEFMTLLPAALKWDQNTDVSVLAGADRERYALRAHGYVGPFHEDTIVQKAGYNIDSKGEEIPVPFDAVECHKQLLPSITEYTQSLERGVRPADVHIGPGNETGTRGMILAMRALEMHRLPHPNAPREAPDGRHQMLHMMDILNVYQVSMEEFRRDQPELHGAFVRSQEFHDG